MCHAVSFGFHHCAGWGEKHLVNQRGFMHADDIQRCAGGLRRSSFGLAERLLEPASAQSRLCFAAEGWQMLFDSTSVSNSWFQLANPEDKVEKRHEVRNLLTCSPLRVAQSSVQTTSKRASKA